MATVGQFVQFQERNARVEVELQMILFSSDGRLWLEPGDGKYTLPCIWIPKWSRVTQEAVRAATTTVRFNIFCLWEIRDESKHYLVARIQDSPNIESGLLGVYRNQFANVIRQEHILDLVATAHRETFRNVEDCFLEPFKSFHWVAELERRLEPALQRIDAELTGNMQQLNASPTFALLKLETTDTPLWFKAVGEPNLAEYALTIGLSELIPDTGPPIVAHFPDWHAWVTLDSGGNRLDSSVKLEDWKFATNRLADIQISSLRYIDEFFRLGCTDCRTSTLTNHLETFVEAMRRAMAEDLNVDMIRLDYHHIRQVADAVQRAISELEALSIPNTLVHRDLSGGNIQISASRCHFIDWAQGCIGHPFICSEYMQVHFARAISNKSGSEYQVAELAKAYASRWSAVLTPKQIRASLRYSPLLAEYLYVIPMDGRTSIDLLDTRENRRVMRSMVRRMWRATQQADTAPLDRSEGSYV